MNTYTLPGFDDAISTLYRLHEDIDTSTCRKIERIARGIRKARFAGGAYPRTKKERGARLAVARKNEERTLVEWGNFIADHKGAFRREGFANLKQVAREARCVEDVNARPYGLEDGEPGKGIVIPVIGASGTVRPEDRREYWHWCAIRRDGKHWVVEAWGTVATFACRSPLLPILYLLSQCHASESEAFEEYVERCKLARQ